MSGSITDVLALAEAINARRASDDRFGELLGEISTALAEILAAMESKGDAPAPKPLDIEALSKSLAAAMVVAIKSMPAPSVTVQAPDIKLPATEQTPWKRLRVAPVRNASGGVDGYDITRSA